MERFSQAADNNKTPILAVLTEWLGDGARVLEVGSGCLLYTSDAADEL